MSSISHYRYRRCLSENEQKKLRDSFDRFRKSKEWGMICMIHEEDDIFHIVIRDENQEWDCRCLCGVGWEKTCLTSEQVKSILAERQRLEQSGKAAPSADSATSGEAQSYRFGVITHGKECGMHSDGEITAGSPEEAMRELCQKCGRDATITLFY